jgi:hypothetical protein
VNRIREWKGIGMKKEAGLLLAICALVLVSHNAMAEVTCLKCTMETTFMKPGIGDSQWRHDEGSVTKYFKIDPDEKMVSTFNARLNRYDPICNTGGDDCSVAWSDGAIEIDGLSAPGPGATADVDFRRFVSVNRKTFHAVLVVEDHGGNGSGKPNMTWRQEGDCTLVAAGEIKPMPYPPGPHSENYVDARVFPVSDEERDQALATRYKNTVTGLSGGSRWFHMWFFQDGWAYLGDGDDIIAEGAPRQMYVGKETSGAYRLCEQPIPAEGATGCYPLPRVKIGDRWLEHDVYGDAIFELLPGRQ